MPTAAEALAGLPAPRADGAALRAAVRAMRAADGTLLGVLDDDPTGSQAVHGVQVVTAPDEADCAAALARPGRGLLRPDQHAQPRRAVRRDA